MALAVSPRRRWAGLLLVALLGSGRAFVPAPRSTPTPRDVARHGKGFGAAAQKSKKPLKLLKKEKAMTAEEREEAYYRRWFWDQASAAIDERFGRDHTEAELRRVTRAHSSSSRATAGGYVSSGAASSHPHTPRHHREVRARASSGTSGGSVRAVHDRHSS